MGWRITTFKNSKKKRGWGVHDMAFPHYNEGFDVSLTLLLLCGLEMRSSSKPHVFLKSVMSRKKEITQFIGSMLPVPPQGGS